MAESFSFGQVGEALTLAGVPSKADLPTVLLVATERWYPTARIGMALAEAGCYVDAVCPSKHPLHLTGAVRQMFRYKGLRPLASLSDGIRKSNPDLVVPADDLATWHLHELHRRESSRGGSGLEICRLIERSLGALESFSVVNARNAFMQVASEEGIRVPRTRVIASISDLHEWISQVGFPMVLKANGTSGGDGVKVVSTVAEAECAFRKLQSPPVVIRALKRAVIDRDLTLVRPSLIRRRAVVSAQTFVAGHEATSALFCWRGKVLASLHFEVLQKVGSTGHATVVRRIEHLEMSTAAEKIVARLQLSGFHGLDFMIEDDSTMAYLIEINPRTTQVGHLKLGQGRDLPSALYSVITGKSPKSAPKQTANDTIALFPKEWMRDPQSMFLQTAYHDVPWQEAELFRNCVNAAKKLRLWYSSGYGSRVETKEPRQSAVSQPEGTLARMSGALRSED